MGKEAVSKSIIDQVYMSQRSMKLEVWRLESNILDLFGPKPLNSARMMQSETLFDYRQCLNLIYNRCLAGEIFE